MLYLRVKNWGEFQHYTKRNPPWIKLYTSLLEDYDFNRLKDQDRLHLMLLWLWRAGWTTRFRLIQSGFNKG